MGVEKEDKGLGLGKDWAYNIIKGVLTVAKSMISTWVLEKKVLASLAKVQRTICGHVAV